MEAADSTHLELAPGLRLPQRLVRFRFDTSSGPGGQNVNKLATRVTVLVDLTELAQVLDPAWVGRLRRAAGSRVSGNELAIVSQTSRSQRMNRQDALAKLGAMLESTRKAPRKRRATRPTKASVQRRLEAKKKSGERKQQRRRSHRSDE